MVSFLLFWGILGITVTLISFIFDKKSINNQHRRTFFILLFFLISWLGVLLYWIGPFYISILNQKLMW